MVVVKERSAANSPLRMSPRPFMAARTARAMEFSIQDCSATVVDIVGIGGGYMAECLD